MGTGPGEGSANIFTIVFRNFGWSNFIIGYELVAEAVKLTSGSGCDAVVYLFSSIPDCDTQEAAPSNWQGNMSLAGTTTHYESRVYDS